MKEKVSAPSIDDLAYLDTLRDWLRGYLEEKQQASYNELNVKIFLVDHILKNNLFDRNQEAQMHALGLGLGDALAQKLGMEWVIVEGDYARLPELILPKTSLRLSAFTMIQKRLMQDEEVNVIALYEALCERVEALRTPKRSVLGRLFGQRLI